MNWLRTSIENDINNYKLAKHKEELDQLGYLYVKNDYSNLEYIIMNNLKKK
jgi:hypothetical protein